METSRSSDFGESGMRSVGEEAGSDPKAFSGTVNTVLSSKHPKKMSERFEYLSRNEIIKLLRVQVTVEFRRCQRHAALVGQKDHCESLSQAFPTKRLSGKVPLRNLCVEVIHFHFVINATGVVTT